MVHITDEGVFNEPLEKIWRFVTDQRARHEHEFIKARNVIEQKGMTTLVDNQVLNPDRKGTHTERWKVSLNPPKGYEVEYLTGPMAGSKMTQTYTALSPKQTKASVAGDYRIVGMDDVHVKNTVMGFLEMVFHEDVRNLARYK
jgi:hypothetical protein